MAEDAAATKCDSIDLVVSIVSHGHNAMVNRLVKQIASFEHVDAFGLVLTQNIPDTEELVTPQEWGCVKVLVNNKVAGFGANHNAAFRACEDWRARYFLVLNPDVEWLEPVVPTLLQCMDAPDARDVAVCSPTVVNAAGEVEDHARKWPTLTGLIRKLLIKDLGTYSRVEIAQRTRLIGGVEMWSPDWIAGMFMFWRGSVFRQLKGFDERYKMYYEDVDVCLRAKRAAFKAFVLRDQLLIHFANRSSRKKANLALIHLSSGLRFFVALFSRGLV